MFVAQIFYGIGFTLVKMSIITFYRRLFPTPLMHLSTSILAGFIISWGIAFVFSMTFSCDPVNGFWDAIPQKCINLVMTAVGFFITNILIDMVLLYLPMRDVWHLQMSRRSRIAINGLFVLSSFIIVVSCLRIRSLVKTEGDDFTCTNPFFMFELKSYGR
ncbi:hypothetical protein M426DRAFT_11215 [Hypoxylon sp. CI-4A]|nr:hypothetical protein M426DRAFT_11215 [Hypoxylon sp. CI-4A]